MRRSAATGRACRRARCCRAIPASGRRPRAPASRRPTSRSRARASTASRAWCISSASSRPASPRRSPSPMRCWDKSNKMPRPEETPMLKKVLFVSVALAFTAAAQAQTKWDMPTPYAEGEFHTRNVKAFVEDVKKNTGGAVDITVHSAGSLIKHPDILRAISTGQVAIGELLLGQFGNEDPVFAADNVPFVAPGYDNAWKFYQAQKPVLEKKLEGRGMKLLYAVAWPGQGIYTKEPVKAVSDFKGLKMRTYSPLTARLAELLGSAPTVVQVPEIPQMFATGAMHAMVTSSATGTSSKAWEFVKNYYKTNAWNPKNVVVVNE